MSKIALVAVGAAAYVLGAKAGRERYEQISEFSRRWWNDPRVQQKKSEATEVVKDKAPEAKAKLSDAAKHAADKAGLRSDDETNGSAGGKSTSGSKSSVK